MPELDTALDGEGGDDAAAEAAATAAAEAEAAAAAKGGEGDDAEAAAAAAALAAKGGDAEEGEENYWEKARERFANGDEKLATRAARYASPEATLTALIAAQNRISSGELLSALPENATEDEVKAWRVERGLPEDSKGYDLKGIEIQESDQPIIDSMLEYAHKSNQTLEQVKTNIEWYHEAKATQEAARQELDETQKNETLDSLNTEWGPDFRRNQNMVKGFLDRHFPADVVKELTGGRLGSGRGFFNNAEMLRSFLALELELNPAGVVTPSGGGDMAQGLNDQIEAIEKQMKSHRKSVEGKKYWEDDKVQAHYRKLLTQRDGNKETA